ncbi:prolipoprotein diacylglyceryl transferase [Pseudoxanthomonas broegbernensis]|uniref:Phosphatidylglycerol--prolipoprotein diacylglyceryl transferase n=1 Tax=Pseudoxanthomonas broegbernensis TaxID=83619 RepID=A0A7V8K722_9GAMM|nr:prolipoprotein diacylglyceryl transferase [Pseudoxanthomonas broegbernensis]KAF1686532.1 prolipoprotein diacylglyceryl transferase [Pseudoxanthomonas broegbernensis]MBB6064206.1 phosphatidylglycerol:prolipoprotein diacylglycerol transferase [Pseudoxanthomonas broegbernensis]
MIVLHQIDPIAVSLGPLQVHWYGLMYLLAFAAAWWLGRRRVAAGRLPGVDANAFSDLLFYAMLGVILGGRLGYVLFYGLGEALRDPLMVVRVWDGGMSFHGGLLGVLVAAWLWSRRQGLHFFDTMDFVAPLVPPGLGFGRLGNYIGGELWGKYTEAGWGVVFPAGLPERFRSLDPAALKAQFDAGALDAFARHPSQLYQAALEGAVMFAALWWFSSRPRPRYAVAGLFALLYGCFRFLVEFVRVPDAQLGYLAFGWLTMGQVLSLPLVALGLYLLWRSRGAPVLHPRPVQGEAR